MIAYKIISKFALTIQQTIKTTKLTNNELLRT